MIDVEVRRCVTKAEARSLKATVVPHHDPIDLPEGECQLRDVDSGQIVAVVARAPAAVKQDCAAAFRSIPRSTVMRTGGIRTSSNTFGYAAPQKMIQRNAPTPSAWAIADPEGHKAYERFAGWAWTRLHQLAPPDVLDILARARDRVHTDWRLADTAWTSGIANDTVPIYYHLDANNVAHSWSAMLATRAGVKGGGLHIVEYGITLPIRDGDVTYFPGVDLVHGVTPMRRLTRDGFRYTFVLYPVRAFQGLPGHEQALLDAQSRRTVLEENQIERQRAAGMIR